MTNVQAALHRRRSLMLN